MKILIICSNLIGDTILSTGVIKHFVDQYKDAKISLVIGPTAAPIFRNYKNIDEVIIFKKDDKVVFIVKKESISIVENIFRLSSV